MRTLDKLIDDARKVCSRDSDRAVAEALGVTAAAVSTWRKGGTITEQHLGKLIALAQADPALFVQVRKEEDQSPEAQKLWGALWDRLSPVTTVIGALAVVALGVHAGAHEALLVALSPVAITPTFYTLCEVGLLTLLCALAAYQCWSLHRKRTGR
ncbi:hypothetical protein JH291_18465 [Xanthomonas campestris pv. campestris]|uniref:DUF3693 domain-containing protein n=1 Tax=Xanthomonas campestris TaxID=339 RepID=UPI002378F627|nr:DUF3693 domain-containing protein [Xanthomonas campestris]WDL45897.1 hypothetical protein JH291_18465 [Xanthomonas campestris pv. campestris]